METVQCRSEQEIGRVIGRGGSTVERIQAETGTKIQVDSRTLCVDVKGYPSDVREAARIVTLVTQEGFGGSVERVPCTGSEGAVIGPKGARIRAIAKETKARLEVQVSDDGDGSSECVIRGSPPEVAAAAAWVRELVAMDRDDRDAARDAGGTTAGVGTNRTTMTTGTMSTRISNRRRGTRGVVEAAFATGTRTPDRCETRRCRSGTTKVGSERRGTDA